MCVVCEGLVEMGDTFESWIGRGVTREDVVTPRLLGEYRASLEPFLFRPEDQGVCPPGLHWGLAPAMPGMTELGPDGAEAKGLFLPPIPLPRRMWAGGAVETFAPIRLGMQVARTSAISDLRMRDGKTGALCFVSVTHEITSGGALLLRERQDLVFREAGPGRAAPATQIDTAKGDLEWTVETSAALLFRFSAFTFNGHRIHYDVPYAVETEGHAGLIVHGPLQAALLLNQASVALGRVPQRFDYRCTAPLIAGPAITVATILEANGASSRIRDHRGIVTSAGTATA